MSEDVVIDAFGAHWRLDLDDLDTRTRARVVELWGRAVTDRRDDVLDFLVTPDAARSIGRPSLLVPEDLASLPYALSRAITQASIIRRAGRDLMFHAAGVSTTDGVAAALVAASGTGKTTAAVTLSRHFGYLSDETVAIGPGHSVAAYPKPLSVLDPDTAAGKTEHSPDSLGLLIAPSTPRLGVVVLLHRDPAVVVPRLAHIPLVDALLDAIPQTSSLPRLQRPLQVLAGVLTLAGGPWRLTYAEIADCVDLVRDLLVDSVRTAASTPWAGVDPPRPEATWPADDAPVQASTLVVRAPWSDAIATDGEILVLHDAVPLRLSGIGGVLWEAASAPTRVADLVPAVVRVHGSHPDARALVVRAAAAMVEAGALLPVAAT